MIKFYLESMITPGHYYKWHDTAPDGSKWFVWTSSMDKAHSFENSVEGIHHAQTHFPHHECKIRQKVDYSDMWYG